MKPDVVAGTSPRDGVDTVFGATDDADEQATPVETYLLEALERLDAAESRALQARGRPRPQPRHRRRHRHPHGAPPGDPGAGVRRAAAGQHGAQRRLHVLALEVVETGLIDRS